MAMMLTRKFHISIGTGLILGVITLVVATAALVHIPWSVTARVGVTDLAKRLNEQLVDNAGAKMSALLDDAASTGSTIVANIQSGVMEHAKEGREALLLSFLQTHASVSAIEIGWQDDRSLAVRRLGNQIIVVEETRPSRNEGLATRQTAEYSPGGAGVLARGP